MDVVPRAVWTRQKWGPLSPMTLPARRLWIHHGATGNADLATLRAYERYHVQNRGWAGLGYSFAIVGNGTVFEGRGGHIGAHTAGDNAGSLGICLVGDWSRLAPPRPMVEALAHLTLHLADTGLLNAAAITGGHRDAPGATTVCPGNGGMQAVVEARRLIVQRLDDPTTAAPPPEPEEDPMLLREGDAGNHVAAFQRALTAWRDSTARRGRAEWRLNADGQWGGFTTRLWAEYGRASGLDQLDGWDPTVLTAFGAAYILGYDPQRLAG